MKFLLFLFVCLANAGLAVSQAIASPTIQIVEHSWYDLPHSKTCMVQWSLAPELFHNPTLRDSLLNTQFNYITLALTNGCAAIQLCVSNNALLGGAKVRTYITIDLYIQKQLAKRG